MRVLTVAANCRLPSYCVALGFTVEDILEMFFENNVYEIQDGKIMLHLVPERLRGETAAFEVKKAGKVLIEKGRRITARHIALLDKAGIKTLEVPLIT